MIKTRGFAVVTGYANHKINLPGRKTPQSAGYDIEAADDAVLPPGQVTLVPTGLKAYMQDDEYLSIHIRSGFSIKKAVSLINGQGIIDADYYNNPDNEGHIMIALFNHSVVPVAVKKGDRVVQGIFCRYFLTGDDREEGKTVRLGGFGSTHGF